MIYTTLAEAGRYEAMGPRIKQAVRFLQATDLQSLEPGRYEIDGDNLFANVFSYNTKFPELALYEGHREYIDLQYLCSGEEDIYCGFLQNFTMKGNFDSETDVAFFEGQGFPLRLGNGRLLMLWPEDIHAPGIDSVSSPVRKIVIKIKL